MHAGYCWLHIISIANYFIPFLQIRERVEVTQERGTLYRQGMDQDTLKSSFQVYQKRVYSIGKPVHGRNIPLSQRPTIVDKRFPKYIIYHYNSYIVLVEVSEPVDDLCRETLLGEHHEHPVHDQAIESCPIICI